MSCEKNPNKAVRAAKANGIARIQSKSAYLSSSIVEKASFYRTKAGKFYRENRKAIIGYSSLAAVAALLIIPELLSLRSARRRGKQMEMFLKMFRSHHKLWLDSRKYQFAAFQSYKQAVSETDIAKRTSLYQYADQCLKNSIAYAKKVKEFAASQDIPADFWTDREPMRKSWLNLGDYIKQTEHFLRQSKRARMFRSCAELWLKSAEYDNAAAKASKQAGSHPDVVKRESLYEYAEECLKNALTCAQKVQEFAARQDLPADFWADRESERKKWLNSGNYIKRIERSLEELVRRRMARNN
jgi:hypothetical protein